MNAMMSSPSPALHLSRKRKTSCLRTGFALVFALAMAHAAAQPAERSTTTAQNLEEGALVDTGAGPARLEACPDGLTPAERTRLVTVHQALSDDKPHAALAMLDAIKSGAGFPSLDILRAEALRKIRRLDRAKTLLTNLKGTCFEGRVLHSLGLIAALEGDEPGSISHLERASKAIPLDPQIRSDLGYAYMAAGRLDDALFELSTAHELAPNFGKAIHNLIVLSQLSGDSDMTDRLIKKFGVSAPVAHRLADAAQRLKRSPAPPSAPLVPDEKASIQ